MSDWGETETQMLFPASVKNTPAGTSQETLVSFIIPRENPLHGVPFLRLWTEREDATLLCSPGAIAGALRSRGKLVFGGVFFCNSARADVGL